MVRVRKLKGTVPLREPCTKGHLDWQKQNATQVHLNYQLLKLQLKALSYPSVMFRAANQILLIKLKKQDPCEQQDKGSPCEVQVSTHITVATIPKRPLLPHLTTPPVCTEDSEGITYITPYNKHLLTLYIGKCPRLRLDA